MTVLARTSGHSPRDVETLIIELGEVSLFLQKFHSEKPKWYGGGRTYDAQPELYVVDEYIRSDGIEDANFFKGALEKARQQAPVATPVAS